MEKIHSEIAEKFQNKELLSKVQAQLNQWQLAPKISENKALDFEEAEQLASYSLNEEYMMAFLDQAASREEPNDLNNLSWNLILETFGLLIQKIHDVEHFLNPSSEYTLDSFTNEVNESQIQASFNAVLQHHSQATEVSQWVQDRLAFLEKNNPWNPKNPMGTPVVESY